MVEVGEGDARTSTILHHPSLPFTILPFVVKFRPMPDESPVLPPSRMARWLAIAAVRSEEHTSELQSPCNLVCRLLLEKKKPSLSPTTFSITLLPNFDVPLLSEPTPHPSLSSLTPASPTNQPRCPSASLRSTRTTSLTS